MALIIISWLAVLLGLTGSYYAGRSHNGWLYSTGCCLLWAVYNYEIHIWAGLFSAVLGIGISIRNYLIGRAKRAPKVPSDWYHRGHLKARGGYPMFDKAKTIGCILALSGVAMLTLLLRIWIAS